jgi:ABC-type uncharacterized transport system permease subunit
MTTTAITKKIEYISPTRQRWMGVIFSLLGLAIYFGFVRNLEPGIMTTYTMTPGGSAVVVGDWSFITIPVLQVLSVISIALGIYQFIRGFGKRTNAMLGLVAGFFVFSFLSWATAGSSINLAGLLRNTLIRAVPITIAAFSGILTERSGVINIGIEGMLLGGAMVGALIGSLTNMWIGLLAGVLIGGLMAWVHGVLSIKYKTNQIISSNTLLIFATGMTSFISARFMQQHQELNNPGIFQNISIPYLSDIPFVGPILFDHNLFVYGMFFFLILLHISLFFTRWGLRVRSVGEHPKAADTLGINVLRTRYIAVILSGLMAGFGGAYFTLGSVGRFDEVMTAGRGFIGLAAMIFGNYSPFGAFGAGLLFGFADSLAGKLAILGVRIPSEFLLMTPYIATMVVLAGVVGRGRVPAADGVAYEKE